MTKTLIAILMAAALASVASAAVFAHEGREVGDYRLVVGFINEPAYEGEMNAVSIRVTGHEATPGGNAMDMSHQPPGVEGLEDTLEVEVTHVPSNVSRTMSLRAVFDDAGHYVADLIPTSPGHYRFRFFGTIESEGIDETFESRAGGGSFDDVQAAAVVQFPQPQPSVRELESAVRGAQDAARQAQDTVAGADSATASALGIIGIALGAAGIAVGGAALLSGRGRNS